MGRPDSILGQFGETARCRDARHGGGVCCAFAPQLAMVRNESIVVFRIKRDHKRLLHLLTSDGQKLTKKLPTKSLINFLVRPIV